MGLFQGATLHISKLLVVFQLEMNQNRQNQPQKGLSSFKGAAIDSIEFGRSNSEYENSEYEILSLSPSHSKCLVVKIKESSPKVDVEKRSFENETG